MDEAVLWGGGGGLPVSKLSILKISGPSAKPLIQALNCMLLTSVMTSVASSLIMLLTSSCKKIFVSSLEYGAMSKRGLSSHLASIDQQTLVCRMQLVISGIYTTGTTHFDPEFTQTGNLLILTVDGKAIG